MENQNDKQPQQHTLDLNWSPDADDPSAVEQLTNHAAVTETPSQKEPVDTTSIDNDIAELEGNLTAIEETEFAGEPSPFNKELIELTDQLTEAFEESNTEPGMPYLEEDDEDETDESSPHNENFARGNTPDYSEDDLSAIPLIHSESNVTEPQTDLPTEGEIIPERPLPEHTKLEQKAVAPTSSSQAEATVPKPSSIAEPVTLPVAPKNKFIFMNKETALTADQIDSEPTDADLNNCGDTIGGRLKAGRLQRKLSFLEIEEITKIKKEHVINLENNRFDLLPAPVYTRAYIRKLSIAYSMVPDELVGVYNEKINNTRLQHPVTKAKVPSDDGFIDDTKKTTPEDGEQGPTLRPSLFKSNKKKPNHTKKALIALPVVLVFILAYLLFFSKDKNNTEAKNATTINKSEMNSKDELNGVIKRATKPTIEPEVLDIPTY